MKRSEMIDIIEAELYMFGEDQALLTSIAKGILDRIEECGMIPPDQYACTNEHRFEWEDEE